MKSLPKPGDRIELTGTTDLYTRLALGSQGTVRRVFTGDEPRVFVEWDDGSRLSLLPDEGDSWKVVE